MLYPFTPIGQIMLPRHCEPRRGVAIYSFRDYRLLRRYAPHNDEGGTIGEFSGFRISAVLRAE